MSDRVCKVIIPNKPSDQRTVIVLGVARSGTSMVTGLIRELGIFMGDIDIDNHEDPMFANDNIEDLKKIINQRNQQYSNWGWKVPKTIFCIHELLPFLRNPCFIVLTRDPFDIAHSMQHRTGSSFDLSIEHIFMVYHYLETFIEFCVSPIAIVSYNRAVNDREMLVQELIDFLNFENIHEETLAKAYAFVSGSAYKPTSHDKELSIHLDRLPVDPFDPGILMHIRERTKRLLQMCRDEIQNIQATANEILSLHDLGNSEKLVWHEELEHLPTLQDSLEKLCDKNTIEDVERNISSAEGLRQDSKSLLNKVMNLKWTGIRTLYKLNRLHI
ncbi:MAG: hypothetical protein HC769_32795 [Cyanobacteria bacterium CRU_2_1]|nr:hypothetical protein [Cyanobacteria bacterium CRU_2_1]